MFEEAMMRFISLLVAGTAVASCTTAPPPPEVPSPRAVQEYQRLIGGKVAQAPVSCIPNYHANDMTTIDGRTLAFRAGGGATVYIAHLTPGCEQVTHGSYALLSRKVGGLGECRGDIEQVVDTINHANFGSCTIAEIVPYVRP
jgi:hypothetical protein